MPLSSAAAAADSLDGPMWPDDHLPRALKPPGDEKETYTAVPLICIECGATNALSDFACRACRHSLAEERRAVYATGSVGDLLPSARRGDERRDDDAASGMGGIAGLSDDRHADRGERWSRRDAEPAAVELRLRPDPVIGPIERRTVVYEVGAESITERRGMVGKTTTSLELWRIASQGGDVEVIESLLQRMRGTGTLKITAPGDSDTAVLYLRDVHDPHGLREEILRRARTEQLRRNRMMIGGTSGPAPY